MDKHEKCECIALICLHRGGVRKIKVHRSKRQMKKIIKRENAIVDAYILEQRNDDI